MTGAEHYREAEMELAPDGGCEYGCPHAGCAHEMAHLARAQVHATLALAAATADAAYGLMAVPVDDAWAQALAGTEIDRAGTR
jgi:hypothetical protein